jgi:carbonic anhydrase
MLSRGSTGLYSSSQATRAPLGHHPFVPRNTPIYGYVYDVRTGALIEVPAATKAGAAS